MAPKCLSENAGKVISLDDVSDPELVAAAATRVTRSRKAAAPEPAPQPQPAPKSAAKPAPQRAAKGKGKEKVVTIEDTVRLTIMQTLHQIQNKTTLENWNFWQNACGKKICKS
jgi:hypothetical protein